MSAPFTDTDRTAMRYRERMLKASERNVTIMGRYMIGDRIIDIARDYGISQARVGQIISSQRMRNFRLRRVETGH